MSKCALFLPLLLVVACGGSPAPKTPEPAEAEPKTETKSEEASDASEKADEEKAESKKSDSKDTKESKDSKPAEKPGRSAQEILTAPDVVFMLSFNDSDVKQAAETKCTASSGNDPKKQNGCMAKARKAIDIDGYQFKEVDSKWFWLTLKTTGKKLTTLHKFEVEFGPETPGSVSVKPKGKDLGSKAGRTPAPFTVQVPNDYQISLDDPKLGKLVYEAKIGLLTTQ
ncbi:MAG TPA: hypothetical protein VER96_17825 [Polyangiaceae bacterium]|nr:hypothetical protein [Polyangiaceae bacterium]